MDLCDSDDDDATMNVNQAIPKYAKVFTIYPKTLDGKSLGVSIEGVKWGAGFKGIEIVKCASGSPLQGVVKWILFQIDTTIQESDDINLVVPLMKQLNSRKTPYKIVCVQKKDYQKMKIWASPTPVLISSTQKKEIQLALSSSSSSSSSSIIGAKRVAETLVIDSDDDDDDDEDDDEDVQEPPSKKSRSSLLTRGLRWMGGGDFDASLNVSGGESSSSESSSESASESL